MLKRAIRAAMLIVVVGLLFCSSASADTVGTLVLTNCGQAGTGCPAATYSFQIGATSATLWITVTGATNSTNNTFQSVNLGFLSQPPNVTGGSTTAGGTWNFVTGPVTPAGCQLGTNAPFTCAYASPLTGFAYTVGTTYSWTWTYDPIDLSTLNSSIHIGANFGPHTGHIVSQEFRVPEPGSLTLLGLGLLGAAIARRRMR